MTQNEVKKVCGIVMPISAIDECSESHWSDVLEVIKESIEQSGFEGNLVSNADDVGIIQKRIIQNLYENPIVVCDVSGKNPNVMFELGMRLAFDKPTIIIKDDKTTYSFDTSQIEHIEYPRDLRFAKIVDFKSKLAEKIKATYEKSSSDATYTTFLKHFGDFKVAKIDRREVSAQEYIIDELANIKFAIRRLEGVGQLEKEYRVRDVFGKTDGNNIFEFSLGEVSDVLAENIAQEVSRHPGVKFVFAGGLDSEKRHIRVTLEDSKYKDDVKLIIQKLSNKSHVNRRGGTSNNS